MRWARTCKVDVRRRVRYRHADLLVRGLRRPGLDLQPDLANGQLPGHALAGSMESRAQAGPRAARHRLRLPRRCLRRAGAEVAAGGSAADARLVRAQPARPGRRRPGRHQRAGHRLRQLRLRGLTVTKVARSYAIATAPGTQLEIRQIPFPGQVIPAGSTRVVRGQTNPYQGWVSHQMLQRIPAPVVTMARTGSSAAMLTLISASGPGVVVSTSIRS